MRDRDFTDTVRRYSGWLGFHATQRATAAGLDPDELLQETWIEVWRLWGKIGQYQRIGGILMRVLRWTASKLQRTGPKVLRNMAPIDDWSAAIEPGQEDAVHLRDAVDMMRRSLPPVTVDMMNRMALGDTCREIGEDYGVVHQRVQQRVAGGRQRLRDLVG